MTEEEYAEFYLSIGIDYLLTANEHLRYPGLTDPRRRKQRFRLKEIIAELEEMRDSFPQMCSMDEEN